MNFFPGVYYSESRIKRGPPILAKIIDCKIEGCILINNCDLRVNLRLEREQDADGFSRSSVDG